MNSRLFKESIKAALAFVIGYAIALKINWMSPNWVGYAITMVAFPGFTNGQTYKKSFLRLSGTIPGSIMALIILAIAPQNRFLFIFIIAIWMFVTTYLMIADKAHSYLWNVAGFTCLIVVLASPSSSSIAIEHAIYRIIDNTLGMLILLLSLVLYYGYILKKIN